MNPKKLILLTLLIVVMAFTAKSENPPPGEYESTYKTMMINDIKDLVGYPDFARELDIQGFVLVSFSYDLNGNLLVLESNSNSELLKNYVATRLKQLDMCTHAKTPDRVYNLRFDFVLI